MNMTQSLLEFILTLLRDSDAKAAFIADPDRALADAGLSEVCSEDIADAMSYVAEYHPVTLVGPREYNLGNGAISQHVGDHRPDHDDRHDHRPEDYHPGPHATPVQQLEYITNNYSYTDSHDTLIDKSVNQSIWNEGVLNQRFDDHSVMAGDHSVAAGRDIDGTVVNGDDNVVGDGNSVGNTYHRDDHSQDNSVHDSFNGNNIADRGGVAGRNNDGNVTNPDHSAIATNGSAVDSSTRDSQDTTISDSFTDSHDRESYRDNYNHDDSHHTSNYHHNEQSFNDGSFNPHSSNHGSYNDHSAISHTEQDGLINANVSPVLNLPIDRNDVHVLSSDTD